MFRPKQTDCRNEPGYPQHDTVVFCLKYPELTLHKPSKKCKKQEVHLIRYCGEWFGE